MMTRCAACGTAFRITTDQLLARQGTVRCGNCQAIFNALDHLVPDPATLETAAAPTAAATVTDHAEAAPVDLFNAAAPYTDPVPVEVPGVAEGAQEPVADDLALVYSPEPVFDVPAGQPLLPADAAANAQEDGIEPASLPAEETAAEVPLPATAARAKSGNGAASTLFEPSKPERGFPWWSSVGMIVTLIALATQGAWFYRNQLAAQYPEAKPLLQAACAELRCRIEAPVDPQAISIESSDLQADPANRTVLILSAVVRNRAPFAQKLPLLELSLTDAQDAPIARRVLKAPEYAPAPTPESIGPGSELQLRVFIDAGAVKANGYRLYAFYP